MYIKAVFHDNILYELCPLIALKNDGFCRPSAVDNCRDNFELMTFRRYAVYTTIPRI